MLILGGAPFLAKAPVRYEEGERLKSASDLQLVREPALYVRLLATRWKRAGRLGMTSEPFELDFANDGTCTERDEQARCAAISAFDLTGAQLTVHHGWHSCDGRNGTGEHWARVGTLSIEDDLFAYQGLPDAVYRPYDSTDSTQIVMAQVRDLSIRATFPPHLRPGEPFSVVIQLQNLSHWPRTLRRFGIGEYHWVKDSLTLEPFAARDLQGAVIAPGEVFRDTLLVTLNEKQMASEAVLHVSTLGTFQAFNEWIALTGLAAATRRDDPGGTHDHAPRARTAQSTP